MTDALKPEYPPLPHPAAVNGYRKLDYYTEEQVHAMIDSDRAARSQPSALTKEQIVDIASMYYAAHRKPEHINFARAILSAAGSRSSDAEDARRYRWLRLALSDRKSGRSHWFCSIPEGQPSELDESIDAALRSQPMGRGE
ncbi:MAG: hypothetical protein J0H69_17160 [Burkholderiales bacterium]|nr:hypothetical protein [Burkholderiales bacterium]